MPRHLPAGAARIALVLAALVACASAPAQEWSGSVAAATDYRFRGVSLSGGRPSVQAGVNVDARSGAYGGLFLASARLGAGPDDLVQWLPYAGYAARWSQEVSIDAGVAYSGFTRGNALGYGELHAGVALPDLRLRLSYAPDYFRSGVRTVYLQGDLDRVLAGRLHGELHLGRLGAVGGVPPYDNAPRWQDDLRAGVALRGADAVVRISWTGVDRVSGAYPVQDYDGNPRGARSTWVLQCSFDF